QDYPESANTLQSQTGRGRHFYFQCEPGIRNSSGILGHGIDVRAEGGFVILPPSVHGNGKRYEWLNNFDPLPLPDSLKQILCGTARVNGNPPERISEGQRNSTLTSFAGSMRNRGMSKEAIEVALLTENELRCDPPLPQEDVKTIAQSIGRYPPYCAEY